MRDARLSARDTELWNDDTWVMDSTPVECGRSRPPAPRSDLAGWASCGYCASHSRWGLCLHLVCPPAALPITFVLTNPQVRRARGGTDLFETEPTLLRPGQRTLLTRGIALASCALGGDADWEATDRALAKAARDQLLVNNPAYAPAATL